MRYIIILLLCTGMATAQETAKPYNIPFASKGNVIELSVANSSASTAEGVKVEATIVPEGIKFTEKSVTIISIKSKEEQTASFTFTVDKTAKVNKDQTLSFKITDKTGQQWIKEIKINIAPPATYELLQNYPNPFNPTTTIEYSLPTLSGRDLVSNEIRDGQLPGAGTQYTVSLKIYDAIGREVIGLVNEQQGPGYYEKTFNANQLASGMYIYQLIATDQQKNKHTFQKKMMLLK
jgi:hypothetical protein